MSDTNIKDLIYEKLEIIINETKTSFINVKSFAISEVWKILQLLTAVVIQLIENIADNLSGPEKKKLALEVIGKFYDDVFFYIDIPWVPSPLEPILHSHLKNFLMIFVGAGIDAMVTTFRNVGVFRPKNNTDTTIQSNIDENEIIVINFIKNIKEIARK
jgi:hypothetical protein